MDALALIGANDGVLDVAAFFDEKDGGVGAGFGLPVAGDAAAEAGHVTVENAGDGHRLGKGGFTGS